ncbi:interleukin-20 receptor subunit alpha isoform X2 [Apteryx mantelli]|uniref:Interleukin-20 receptor subunit alpha isoform X2 n=1 Tax=Apteryx mantelli TaxID=2696672 RepID=A0ABM4EDU5_9AVES|nr:PREDICTED: interleukin-20 receptor subunit alpha isoform X1 [Apteryx mantelli mantelli]
MKNVLHWSAPEGTGDGVLYKVKYSVYGVGKWIKKSECRNISRTWCDLSSETSDYEEQYYASVKAFLHGMCSDWIETTRFNPLTDTKIDPPMVSVSSTEKSISVILTAPEKWKRNPEGESISLAQVYPGLQYNVSVLNKKTKKRWWFSVSNNTLVVPWLEPGTAYCVSAQIHVTTPLLNSGFSKEYCIATLKVACYCVHRYIHVSKQKHPTNLVWHYTDKCKERVFIPCEKIVVNLITINVDEYKPSRESIHLSEGKSPRYYTVYNGTEGKNLPPKEVLETKQLLDISHEVDIFSKGDQTRNWPSYGQAGTKNSLSQKNEGNIEYELDVRAEDFSPTQKLMELRLKEKSSAPRELLGEPHLVGGLDNITVGQPYCPQLEVRAADPCLGQKLEELNLKMVPPADTLLGEASINLVDLGTEKSGQTSCPPLETIAQSLQDPAAKDPEKENEQTILVDWDPHTGRLYIPTLFSVENEACEAVFQCDDPDKEGILSRLYEKQVSDEASEDREMYLLQFKEQWELHVKMED